MITVFTPVYNRQDTLERLYQSLLKQTDSDFEWLIVNDGSSDDSEKIIKKIMHERNPFRIRYYYKENGGKHRAINYAVSLALGELFFIVDSDDWLPIHSIEVIKREVKNISIQSGFAGIGGCKYNSKGEISGDTFCGTYIDATSLDRQRYNIKGEKAEVFFTQLLKRFPFPEFEGEKFISEGIVWNKIAAEGYKIRWINENIYEYEYQENGLTANLSNLYKNNPIGYMAYVLQEVKLLKIGLIQRYNWYGRVINRLRSSYPRSFVQFHLHINLLEYWIASTLFFLYSMKNPK